MVLPSSRRKHNGCLSLKFTQRLYKPFKCFHLTETFGNSPVIDLHFHLFFSLTDNCLSSYIARDEQAKRRAYRLTVFLRSQNYPIKKSEKKIKRMVAYSGLVFYTLFTHPIAAWAINPPLLLCLSVSLVVEKITDITIHTASRSNSESLFPLL